MQPILPEPESKRPADVCAPRRDIGRARAIDSAVYVAAWDRAAADDAIASNRRPWRLVRDVVQTAVLALVLFLGTRTVAEGREVHGPSMQPTYEAGQRVFVVKYLFGDPDRGDVIVFRPPAGSRDDLIKRVIGVPGDRVVIRDGRVSVNGQPADDRLGGARTVCSSQWCDVTLGPDEYYVLGDNRANSADSRLWGPVREDRIVGKAWLRYYPFADVGLVR